MKTKVGIILAALAAVIAAVVVAIQPAQAAVGIRISGGRLVEGNGQPLILRGTNHMHTWYKSQTASFAEIKASGANAVRVVVSGGRWQPAETTQDIVNIINLCKTNKLICILENHDTTGFGEDGAAFSLDQAVNFWISVQSALTGQENYVILNPGNEPIGNNNPAQWTQATIGAIQRLRNAGFQHTIMIDAPNWGQDWQFVMRDNAQAVYSADATGNLLFSIHMYGVFPTAAVINAYLDSFVSRGLPLAIGEFGWVDSDEDAILAGAQARNLGYLSWSWSGNTDPILDMVTNQGGTFLHSQKSTWGTRIISGANGLLATSRQATIYDGPTTTTTTTPPQVPGTPGTPSASNVANTSLTLSWGASSGTVTNYLIERCTGSTCTNFTQVATSTTTSTNQTGLTANTVYRYRVRANNSAGNSGYSAITNVTTTNVTNPQPPGTPGTLNIVMSAPTTAMLAWGASSGTVTNYLIERCTGATCTNFAQIATSTTTNYSNTGLANSTTYRFRVRAMNSAGNSGYTNIANATTANPTTTTTSSSPPVGGCSATYSQIGGAWPGAFQGEVRVTNTGTNATSGWTVTVAFNQAGQRITQIWGGRTSSTASPFTVTNETYNNVLQPSGSTTFGFLGTHSNTGNPVPNPPAPTLTCSRTP